MQEEVLDTSFRETSAKKYREPIEANDKRAKATIILFYSQLAILFIRLIFNLFDFMTAYSNDGYGEWFYRVKNMLYSLYNLVFIATVVLFIMWMFRAYKNVWRRERTRLNPGWAIGGWFIPFTNLYKPVQIASEITRKNEQEIGEAESSRGIKIALWWTFLLISTFSNIKVSGFLFNYGTILKIAMVHDILTLIACGTAISFVKFASSQEEKIYKAQLNKQTLNKVHETEL